jgi:hypothetical protein
MLFATSRRVLNRTQLATLLIALAILVTSFPLLAFGQAPEGKVGQKSNAAHAVSPIETALAFEPAGGQNERGELFTARGHGYAVGLGRDGAVVSFSAGDSGVAPGAISLGLTGSNPQVAIAAGARQAGVSNYIPSSDAKTWRLGVPRWGKVDYAQVYSGVDLSFYGNKQLLEYDFRISAGADPRSIRMTVGGAAGARLDGDGNLALRVAQSEGGEVRLLKPVAYQLSSKGDRQPVRSEYRLTASADGKSWQVGFALGSYDASRELVIDPVLSYGLIPAYVDYNVGGIAADSAGNTYVTGQNQGRGFYVSKYSPTGTLIFNTVVASGLVTCYPTGIVVDGSGNSYVVGTAGAGLPTTANAYQTVSPSSKTYYVVPFVAAIPASGAAPTYLSYVGGNQQLRLQHGDRGRLDEEHLYHGI